MLVVVVVHCTDKRQRCRGPGWWVLEISPGEPARWVRPGGALDVERWAPRGFVFARGASVAVGRGRRVVALRLAWREDVAHGAGIEGVARVSDLNGLGDRLRHH
eukprot:3636668-Pyramimonas_sp.AAC.1